MTKTKTRENPEGVVRWEPGGVYGDGLAVIDRCK